MDDTGKFPERNPRSLQMAAIMLLTQDAGLLWVVLDW